MNPPESKKTVTTYSACGSMHTTVLLRGEELYQFQVLFLLLHLPCLRVVALPREDGVGVGVGGGVGVYAFVFVFHNDHHRVLKIFQ